jgi:hypothetical protein
MFKKGGKGREEKKEKQVEKTEERVWVYLHSINPKQVSTFGYRTSQMVTYISLLVHIILA